MKPLRCVYWSGMENEELIRNYSALRKKEGIYKDTSFKFLEIKNLERRKSYGFT